ncbi:MAG: class I SAM-dependent methyltransferase [Tissierellaceae bacterium]|nr:class I SAM-dependent methyltransferase [Tissierellaceae bacterium]
MRVDELDNTLVSEDEDILLLYSSFKELREVPYYIESEILNIVLDEFKIPHNKDFTLDDKLKKLPIEFINNTIKVLNSKFNENKKVDYINFYLPYLMYYLPCNIFKVWKPLIDLHVKNLLRPSLKVLDIGTGPGSITLGIIEFYKEMATRYSCLQFSLSFTLIDKEAEFIKIAKNIVNSIKKYLPSNLSIDILSALNDLVTETYKNDELGKFDIIAMSNVLAINELDNNRKGAAILENLSKYIEENGSMIVIEPGDFPNIESLKRTRNKLISKATYNLFSPCNRIWEEKNDYSCNCISMTRTYWKVPTIYKYLSNYGLSKKLRPDVPFSYVVLRIDGMKKYEVIKNQQFYNKLEELKDYCGETVNLMAMIRTVVDTKSGKIIALCDGTTSFGEGYSDYCLIISDEEICKYFADVPIIASERINLKKVKVASEENKIKLYLTDHSKVHIEY